jgi:hypothetical protein
MARPAAAIAVALLALLFIHGVASLPDATAATARTTTARRLHSINRHAAGDVTIGAPHRRHAARKLRQAAEPHPPMMPAVGDVVVGAGGAKKLMHAVETAAADGEVKRQLLSDAAAVKRARRHARALTDYSYSYSYR